MQFTVQFHLNTMDKQAKLDCIREMRLSQIETLKELEDKLMQSMNQPHTTEAHQELYCIYENYKKFRERAMRELKDMDALEKELEK